MSAPPDVRCCYLCCAPARYVGLLEPADPWNLCPLPPAAGKKRVFVYGLCGQCFGVGSVVVAERVEARMKAEQSGAQP